MFFFFKQKTAYEMRISDWSSDVCSSDLSDSSEICCCCCAGGADGCTARAGASPGGRIAISPNLQSNRRRPNVRTRQYQDCGASAVRRGTRSSRSEPLARRVLKGSAVMKTSGQKLLFCRASDQIESAQPFIADHVHHRDDMNGDFRHRSE